MPQFLVDIISNDRHVYRVTAADPAEAAELARQAHSEGHEPEGIYYSPTGLDNVTDIRRVSDHD